MYDYIKGTLISCSLESYRGSHLVVEAQGIGYLISSGKRTIANLSETKDIKVFLSLVHKEDSMSLCGFLTREERDIFNILQTVSGVGVKLSFLILDEFSISELINVVIKEDYKDLSRAKGVGPKMAQKIIIELKDKLIHWSNVNPVDICTVSENNVSQANICEAQNVLLSLGYSANEAKIAIKEVINRTNPPENEEEILRFSLEYLAQI